MKLLIKTIFDKVYQLNDIQNSITIKQLKQIIKEKYGHAESEQRYIYLGKILRNDQTLASLNITNVLETGSSSQSDDDSVCTIVLALPQNENEQKEKSEKDLNTIETNIAILVMMGFEKSIVTKVLQENNDINYAMHKILDETQKNEYIKIKITMPSDIEEIYNLNPQMFIDLICIVRKYNETIDMLLVNPEYIDSMLTMKSNFSVTTYKLISPYFNNIVRTINENPIIIKTLEEIYNFEKDSGIKISDIDTEKIKKIMALGYDYDTVLDAYLICDRNENLTVNYICDNINY